MKPQFKPEEIYIDLSKLSEEQQGKVIALLPGPEACNQYEIFKLQHFILSLDEYNKWWVYGTEVKGKQELTYSQFLDMMGESEEVLQVENKISIKEITELCNEYNRSDLKISNLKRDLEYKKSWNEESFAIQEIKQQISILQKIKETAQSKLQEIGIVF